MKKISKYLLTSFVCLGMLTGCADQSQQARITELKTNEMVNPIGIDKTPYFSWKMQDFEKGQMQTAYQILVSETEEALEKKQYIWDSGKIISDQSVAIPYEGNVLEAENDYFWKVKVWDKEQKEILSETAGFELGKTGDSWEGTQWITCPFLYQNKAISSQLNDIHKYDGFTDSVSEINYDFKMEQTRTGFVWGAKEGRYGEYYLWSFGVENGQVEMTISLMKDEKTLESETYILSQYDAEEFLSQKHKVQIYIQKENVSTYVDDILISENITLEDYKVGAVGFWVSRGYEKAWYDNILIKNSEGEVLYQENFEEMQNMFSPYYIKVEDGWGRADSGFVMTPGAEVPAPMFRKTFDTVEGKEIESVRLYASALGIYEIYVNGTDINPFYGAPGQSVYSEEVYYRTYDLTEYINEGANGIGIMLGHGRYDRAKGTWGDRLALYAQIVIHYQDGTKQIIGTDDTWSVCGDGPVRNDDLFSGEYYDANYEQPGWSLPDFNEEKYGKWGKAEYYKEKNELIKKAVSDHGVKCIDRITPISVTEPVKGVYVYDFGQNFNGVCEIQLSGKANETVTIRYAEYLNTENLLRKDDKTGTIWTRNLGTADNTDYYTFKEDGTFTYSPFFSYRGFRYVQITGVDTPPSPKEIQGLVISTDNERCGYFECSDENMNRLYNAIYYSQLSNYVDIPTDCPQRDERLGWTGDAQVFAYTGSLNANTANFMYKYIDTLRISQNDNGSYPQIVPLVEQTGGSNGWSDAGVIIVWEMYQQYGNKQIIRDNLSAMCRYVDYLVETSDQFIRNFEAYNDHNAISYMDDACCNTAQCTYVAKLLVQMCDIVGEKELAEKYRNIYEQYLSAWQENYLGEDGSIGEWRQSEYTIALAYGLYPEELEQAGAEKLNFSVEASEYHISTGYITTPHILSVLCKYGYIDTAYKLIQQTEAFSWNYMLEQGATTLTEGWHVISSNEDGMININGSLNHVAMGAVGQWFYTDVLGIRRDEASPAYKHFYLEPRIGGDLTYAKGSYDSMYGKIESEWEVTDEGIRFRFVIPANTSATVTLPSEEYRNMELESGTYEFYVKNILPIKNQYKN